MGIENSRWRVEPQEAAKRRKRRRGFEARTKRSLMVPLLTLFLAQVSFGLQNRQGEKDANFATKLFQECVSEFARSRIRSTRSGANPK
jgi:hypothetical protein